MLEDRGLATTVIGLVRPHMEATKGPRGLFVPFPLGRPLGEPGDAGFQRRVLLQALRLLERGDGPVLLEDFAEDAPSQRDQIGWVAPFALPVITMPADAAGWEAALTAEMALVLPWWERAKSRFGRSSVGVSFQAPAAWPGYASAFLAGERPAPPSAMPSPAVALRFVADDLKALYAEAVQAVGEAPSPDQVNAWLFRDTVAGRLLVALRQAALDSDDNGLKTAGGRFLVPVPWLPPG